MRKRNWSSRIVWIWTTARPGRSREAKHVAHAAIVPSGPRTGMTGPVVDQAAESPSGKAAREFREKIDPTNRKERLWELRENLIRPAPNAVVGRAGACRRVAGVRKVDRSRTGIEWPEL